MSKVAARSIIDSNSISPSIRIARFFKDDISDFNHLIRKIAKAQNACSSGLWLDFSDYKRFLNSESISEAKERAPQAFAFLISRPIFVELNCIETFLTFNSVKAVNDLEIRPVLVANDVKKIAALKSKILATGSSILELTNKYILFRPNNCFNIHDFIEHSKEFLKEKILFFEFLPWKSTEPHRMTTKEIYSFLGALKLLGFTASSFPGLESWDDRIDKTLALESSVSPHLVSGRKNENPLISIVIPTHNNSFFVASVIENLFAQTMPSQNFEIIVVDDGSTDDTLERLSNLVKTKASDISFKLIHFPRPEARKSGDSHYRAGITRNLGTQHAKGEWLLFLDSDIVVKPDFLETIFLATEKADVIQCERHHIKPEKCNNRIVKFGDIDLEKDTFIEEEKYWGEFFKTNDWQSINCFWKYTCTYCLLLRRSDFFTVGKFKRTFTTYGFEDVDLGYELNKLGRKFFLLKEKTLHLTPTRHRSEYGHSPWIRHQLLSHTAKTFFRQQLDPVIYELLGIFMSESAFFSRLISRTRSGFFPIKKNNIETKSQATEPISQNLT